MEQTAIKIGNSVGIIIPQKVLSSAGIKLGDKVIVQAKDNTISIESAKNDMGGVDVHFMKMVDEFIEDHKDVLHALANR